MLADHDLPKTTTARNRTVVDASTPPSHPAPRGRRSPRRDVILSAASPDELVEVNEDLGRLKVVPLLQALLFGS